MGPGGIQIGAPLKDFQGVLTGVPVYVGDGTPLAATSTKPDAARRP